MKQIYLDKFKQTFNEFIEEIRVICIDDIDYDKIIIQNTIVDCNETINNFYNKCNLNNNDFSSQNAIIFDKNNSILENIDLYNLWNLNINQETRNGIWKYLFTLYLYSYLFIEEQELGNIIKKYKQI